MKRDEKSETKKEERENGRIGREIKPEKGKKRGEGKKI